MGISIWQILIIVLVILLLFGSRKIPGLMRDLGSGMTAFKRGLKNSDQEGEDAQEVDEASPAVENQEASTSSSSGSKRRSSSRKRSTANS